MVFQTTGAAMSLHAGVPPGVNLATLDQQTLPEQVLAQLRRELQNLRETGSASRGKKTHEFRHAEEMATALREKGWGALVQSLAITPTDLHHALGGTFIIVGADAQGKLIAERGRVGFFQVLRHADGTDRWVELSEKQLDVLGGDAIVVSPEFFNARIGEHPATVEVLRDDDGAELQNITWFVGHRTFFLTTRNFDSPGALQLASAITRQFLEMPHEGWKMPYEFDPENPLHRITRARTDPAPSAR